MIFRALMVFAAGLLIAVTAQAGDAAKGEAIATTVCVACHGADGNSMITLNPKLAGQHPEYLLKQLREFKSGVRANPVMAGMVANLSEEDMANLAAYFSAQKMTGGAAVGNGKGSSGERIYRGGIAALGVPACAACHSPNGAGIPAQFPRLAGQHADYTVAQMKAFRSGERGNAKMMRMIAAKMSDEDIAAVSDYIQGLN
jgi:cytochrome c553